MHGIAVRRAVLGAGHRFERRRRWGRWAPVLGLVACALLALLAKAPQFLAPMGQDQGLYHTVAQEILRGGVPYRDAWDPKPPAVFYTHAALLSVVSDPWRACQVGSLQPRCGTLLFQATDFLYSLVLGGLVLLLSRRFGFSAAARLLAFGFTATFVNLARLDPEGSTPEKYALAPAVGVLLAGLTAIDSGKRRWLLAAGVLAAVAALFKVPDLASFGALNVVLLWNRRARDLPWLWLPLLGVLLGTWALFAAMGGGAAFLDATVTYNLSRVGYQSSRIPLAAVVAAWQLFRDGLALLWLPALIGTAAAWPRPRWRLLVIWAATDVLALFLGGTKFTREYFVQLVPSCSMLAAVAVDSLWREQARSPLGRGWLVVSLAAVALLTSSFQAGFSLRIWNEYVANGWTTTSAEHLSAMLASLPAEESLFVWGDEAELYTLSGHLPATRFLNTAGLAASGDPATLARRVEVVASLTRTPPGVIVVDRRSADDDPDGHLQLNVRYFPELQKLLAEQYWPMDDAVLRPFIGGDREQVFVRQTGPDLCQRMPGCRLT